MERTRQGGSHAERRGVNTAPTILVVDDEPNIVELVRLYLRSEGYQVEVAYDGREALEKASTLHPDLVVLDVMMPELDGYEVTRRLRQDGGKTPVIMLTAKGEDADKVEGLDLGADDYLAKPFNPRELVSRVRAVLRRTQEPDRATRVLTIGNVRVDVARREVTVGGKPVELRTKEFELLLAFAENLGDSRTIDVHVTWLRDKLADASVKIQTIRGIGYKLVNPE
jgi:DNA-binding response OmpR family regulator